MNKADIVNKIDGRHYKVIDVEPSDTESEAYTRIDKYYKHLEGMTVYPLTDEKGKTHYVIVQSKLLSEQEATS